MSKNSESEGKRGPRGPRETFFACFATNGKTTIAKQVKAPNKEKAEQIFEKENGCKARSVLGPYYEVKGSGQTSTNKVFVKLKSINDYQATGDQFTGEFGGWKVLASAIKAVTAADGTKYKDKELVHLMFSDDLVDPNAEEKPKKPRINPAIIPLAQLENAQPRK